MNLIDDSSPFSAEIHRYISVDLETAGPVPEQYALLSIGACTLTDPRQDFYAELQPDRMGTTPEASAVHRLSLERLAQIGWLPADALRALTDWVVEVVPDGQRPIFVAFNAPFDWMFLNTYYYRYQLPNPFGHSALDIKAFAMGIQRVPWKETGYETISASFGLDEPLTHNALLDAQDQAELFLRLLGIHPDKSSP